MEEIVMTEFEKKESEGKVCLTWTSLPDDIREITVPEDVQKIDCTFSGYKKLKRAILPEGLEEIGDNAFACSGIESVNFPASLRKVGKSAFFQTEITSVCPGENFTEIEMHAFSCCDKLKDVVLPVGLKKIAANAFSDSALTHIEVPAVTSIGYKAFARCTSLLTVSMKDGTEEIGEQAFCGCEALKEIVLPEGIAEIKKETFAKCAALEKIVLPSTVKRIGSRAFEGCVSLKEVVLPDGLEEIMFYAFSGCENLESINFPEGLKKVNNMAFYKCYKLPETCLDIVRSIKLKVGEADFYMNEKGGNVVLLSAEGTIADTLYIPDNVDVIDMNAFKGNRLSRVIVNKRATTICQSAFEDSGLKKIYIPATVKEIKENAFAGCPELNIYCEGEPCEGWKDGEEEVRKLVETGAEWTDYQHMKESAVYGFVTVKEYKSYNPEKRPVYTHVLLEDFLKED